MSAESVADEMVALLLARCTFGDEEILDIACSGGPDSTALALLASRTGRKVVLHHVDHGLREGSGDDAHVVKNLADSLGAEFVHHVVTLAPGGNVEARARAARRAVLPATAATGHTMDDQAETVLLNLLRGAGTDGIAGMAPGPTHPILQLRRHETHALCAAFGCSVVTDETNEDLSFRRNRIRAELLDHMSDIADRDVVPLLARTAGIVGREASFIEDLAAQQIPDPTSVAALRAAPQVVADRALRTWLRKSLNIAGEQHPPSEAEMARVRAVVSGAAVATELSGGARLARRAGVLRIEPAGSGTVKPVSPAVESQTPTWASHDLGDVLVPAVDIRRRIAELGAAISADYADEAPLLVGVLKGAIHFLSDLSRAIELPVDMDFMAVSSYGSATKSSGIVRIVKDLDVDLTNRHVLIVEDIVDSGLTLNYLRRYLGARGARSIEVCALLVKDGALAVAQDIRYMGFEIPKAFVVGYGLDVAERYRNLDSIYTYIGEGSN